MDFEMMIPALVLGPTGALFVLLAFVLRRRFRYEGGIRAQGILVRFEDRIELTPNHMHGYSLPAKVLRYDYNKPGSKPVFEFVVDGRAFILAADFPAPGLGRSDIGKLHPIRYFRTPTSACVAYDDGNIDKTANRVSDVLFRTFGGIGLSLLVLAALAWAFLCT